MKWQDWMLKWLYKTEAGRVLLKLFVSPGVSKAAGVLLNSSLSRVLIQPFVRWTSMDLSDYEECRYRSYNDFFTRKVRRGARPVEMEPECLVSPSDGSAMVLPLGEDAAFCVKKSQYTLKSLLRSGKLAEKYRGGSALIVRLAVTDYHRYCYIDDGVISGYRTIPGVFHTVQPIAVTSCPVYHENTREYCQLYSENFGEVVVMEVGAMLVGCIVNDKDRGIVKRGQEKGHFEFGGSTIILLFQKGAVHWRKELLERSRRGLETPVKMGGVLGRKEHTF